MLGSLLLSPRLRHAALPLIIQLPLKGCHLLLLCCHVPVLRCQLGHHLLHLLHHHCCLLPSRVLHHSLLCSLLPHRLQFSGQHRLLLSCLFFLSLYRRWCRSGTSWGGPKEGLKKGCGAD